jgi:hypothetical protein
MSIAGVGFSSPTTEEKDENIPPAAEELSCRFLYFITALLHSTAAFDSLKDC